MTARLTRRRLLGRGVTLGVLGPLVAACAPVAPTPTPAARPTIAPAPPTPTVAQPAPPTPTAVATRAVASPTPAPAPTVAAVVKPTAPKEIRLKFWVFPMWRGVTGKEKEEPGKPAPSYLDWPRSILGKYTANQPSIKLDLEELDYNTGREKINVAVAAGSGPDFWWEDFAETKRFALLGLLEPIDDYMEKGDREDYYPWAIKNATIKGKIWYWPWNTWTTTLVANARIFERLGKKDLLPAPSGERRWSYDQFVEAARAATYEKDGKKAWGYSLAAGQAPGDYYRYQFLWAFGARIFDDEGTKVILNSPEAVEGLQLMLDLQDKWKVIPPGTANFKSADQRNLWNEGLLAMLENAQGAKFALEKTIAEGKMARDLIDLYPVAQPTAKGLRPVYYAGDMAVGVFKKPDGDRDRAAAAMGVCRFITSAENQKAADAVSYFPTRRSTGDIYGGDPFMDFMKITLNSVSVDPTIPWYYALRQFFVPLFQQVLSKQGKPKDLLDDAVRRANEWLAREVVKIKI